MGRDGAGEITSSGLQGIRIGIIGAGRAAQGLASAIASAGLSLAAVFSRKPEAALELQAVCRAAGGCEPARADSLSGVALASDLILLAVSDDAIGEVAKALAAELDSIELDPINLHNDAPASDEIPAGSAAALLHGVHPGDSEQGRRVGGARIAAHLSGSLKADILTPLRRHGYLLGSFHPIRSFAAGSSDPAPTPVKDLAGVAVGLEGDDGACALLSDLADSLGASPLRIPSDAKPAYHASACIASNYLVTLLHTATSVMAACGVDRETASGVLISLMSGTLENCKAVGPSAALTGPIARGDVGTVRSHLEALKGAGDAEAIYRVMGASTIRLASDAGRLTQATSQQLLKMLGDSHETLV